MAKWTWKQAALAVIGIGTGIWLDQVTKIWAHANLAGKPDIEVIPGFLKFQFAANEGVVFGLFASFPADSKRYILIAITSILALVMLVVMIRSSRFASRLAFGLLVTGAVGNIIDRITHHYVIDFIRWYGGFEWPNFNVADIFVCTGVGMMLVFGEKKAPQEKPPRKKDARKTA